MKTFPAARPGLFLLAAMLVAALPGAARAQDGAVPPPAAAPAAPSRASWLTDRIELQPGDIITVIVDERTASREMVTQTGSEQRSLGGDFSVVTDGELSAGPTGVDSRFRADSRQVGEANRQGGLYGMVSARVVGVGGSGIAEIEGHKSVNIDGREQEMTLRGFIRPEDVTAGNVVHSTSLAEASITYKGKNLGPKRGIFGKILSILWPF